MRLLVIPPPVQLIGTAALMWVVNRHVPGLRIDFPGGDLVGGILIAIGLGVEVIAIAAFVQAGTTVNPIQPEKTRKLVTSGLYRLSRNPMYAGMLLLLSGWVLRLGSGWNIGVLIGFVGLITVLQIKPEEEILREKFGDAYTDYCARVRRWL
ncbi:MAG: isoprenylcysteine carboxylmethyltransferase family protein [Pseudomonadota bacterium]